MDLTSVQLGQPCMGEGKNENISSTTKKIKTMNYLSKDDVDRLTGAILSIVASDGNGNVWERLGEAGDIEGLFGRLKNGDGVDDPMFPEGARYLTLHEVYVSKNGTFERGDRIRFADISKGKGGAL